MKPACSGKNRRHQATSRLKTNKNRHSAEATALVTVLAYRVPQRSK